MVSAQAAAEAAAEADSGSIRRHFGINFVSIQVRCEMDTGSIKNSESIQDSFIKPCGSNPQVSKIAYHALK